MSIRTCVVCRGKEGSDELVRLALAPDGALFLDMRGKMPGRGAWVHGSRACLDALKERPALAGRALKANVGAADLVPALREATVAALLDGLSFAAAAGVLIGGHDQLEGELRAGTILEVVVASDASERTVNDLRNAAAPNVPFTQVPYDRDTLGQRVGKGARAALGVQRSRAAHHLLVQLRRLRGLG